MIYGPFPVFFVEKLKTKLEAAGGTYTVYNSEEAKDLIHQRQMRREPSEYPSMAPLADMLHIEIADENLSAVRDMLEQMGVIFGEAAQPETEQPEYHCPKCDFIAPMPVLCPTHKVRLLEFSAWVAERSARQSRLYSRLIIAALAILAFVIYRNS
jgi:hypothetical protein